jgi:site-specific recombinase XerD
LALLDAARAARGSPEATRHGEQRALRVLLPRLGASLARASRADVEALLAQRLAEVSPATAARELSALRALYRVLGEAGRLAHDPTRGLRVKQGAQRRVTLSEAEVCRVLGAASLVPAARRAPERCQALALRNRAACELLYGLGLRAGEACRAGLAELDLSAGVLRVERVKRCAPAALPLSPALVAALRAYLARGRSVLLRAGGRRGAGEERAQGRLLLSERARPLTTSHLGRLVTKIAAKAGVVAHPHAFRRSLATHLVRAGAPLPAVQHLLGHKSLDTTQRYLAEDPEALRAAIDLLEP